MRSPASTPLHELVAAALIGLSLALPVAVALVARDAREPAVREAPSAPTVEAAVAPAPAPEVAATPAAPAPAPAVAPPVSRPSRAAIAASPMANPAPRVALVVVAAPPAAPVAVATRATCDANTVGIERRGDGTFSVDRRLVDAYAKRPSSLARQARVAWHRGPDGRTDGFRLGGIDCGSELHAAGLRSGDVVHSINGRPLTSVPQALWAYSSLRSADELVLRVTRKGKVRSLRYQLG